MVVLEPIGVVTTPYHAKYDAPRQPRIDERIDDAVVVLQSGRNFEQALRDLQGFSHIWLITWFHRVDGWKPMVLPPRSRTKRGVFATRSPHRPNPIGISVVEIIAISGLRIQVRGTDLLDGTPVLDIKPYLPYADGVDHAVAGWTAEADTRPTYRVAWNVQPPPLLCEHVERVLAADPFPHPYRRIKACAEGGYVLAVREHRIRYVVAEGTVTVVAITP